MIRFSRDSVVLRFKRNAKQYKIADEKRNAVLSEKENLLALNKSQIRTGVDSLNIPFSDYFNEDYSIRKSLMSSYKPVSPRPDMYLTGELQNKMDLIVKGQMVNVFSNDPNAAEKIIGKGRAVGRFINAFGFSRTIMPIAEEIVTGEFLSNTYKALFRE